LWPRRTQNDEFENSQRTTATTRIKNNEEMSTDDLPNFIDVSHVERLHTAGFAVERGEIPKAYTPKNTLLLASPPYEKLSSHHKDKISNHPRRLAPVPKFSIPLDGDIVSLAVVKSLAGRVAAERRKRPPPPSRCVSVFMPDEMSITPESLLASILRLLRVKESDDPFSMVVGEPPSPTIHVEYADEEAYLHPAASGMYARTFRIIYKTCTKAQATSIHGEVCSQVMPEAFMACKVRR
jgi:hypothetical protein